MSSFIFRTTGINLFSSSKKKNTFIETILVALGATLVFSFFFLYFTKPSAGTDPLKYIGISLMDLERYPGHTNRYMHVFFLKFFIYLAKDAFMGFRLYTSFTMATLTVLTYLCARDLTRHKNRLAAIIAVLFVFSHKTIVSHDQIRDIVAGCFILSIIFILTRLYDASNERLNKTLLIIAGFLIFICFKIKEFHGLVLFITFGGAIIFQEFSNIKKYSITTSIKRLLCYFFIGLLGIALGQLFLCILDGIFYKDFFWSLDLENWKKQAEYVLKDALTRHKTGKDIHTGISWFHKFLNSREPVLIIVFILHILSLPAMFAQKRQISPRMLITWAFPALNFSLMTFLGLKYVFMAGTNPVYYSLPVYIVMSVLAAQVFIPHKDSFEALFASWKKRMPENFSRIFKNCNAFIVLIIFAAIFSAIIIYFVQLQIMHISFAWPRWQAFRFFTSESAPILMILLFGVLIIFNYKLRPIALYLALIAVFFTTGFTIYSYGISLKNKIKPYMNRENSYEPVWATRGIIDSCWNKKKKISILASNKFASAYLPDHYLHSWHYYIRSAFATVFNKRMENIQCFSTDLSLKTPYGLRKLKTMPDFILMTDTEWEDVKKKKHLNSFKLLNYYKMHELPLFKQRKMYCFEAEQLPQYIDFNQWTLKKVEIIEHFADNAPNNEEGMATLLEMQGPDARAYVVNHTRVNPGDTGIASVWLWSKEPVKIQLCSQRHGSTKFEGSSNVFLLTNTPTKIQVEHQFKQTHHATRLMLQSMDDKKGYIYIWNPMTTFKKVPSKENTHD